MGALSRRLSLVVFIVFLGFSAAHFLGTVSTVEAEAPQESVTGHAEFIGATGAHARYSVNAIRHRDGSVSGEFEFHVETATGDFLLRSHVTITCFTITGNIARIGGFVDRSSGIGAPPGTEGFITVVDNGEGANEVPDLASPTGIGPGTAFDHCDTGLFRPLFPIERGNIQVRPTGF
jgi:hypothetical protein